MRSSRPESSLEISNPLANYGNETEGYSIEIMGADVVVNAWGFWSATLALGFEMVIMRSLRTQGRGFDLVVNVAHLRPLRDEAQAAFEAALSTAGGLGVKVIVKSPTALTKLQFLRLAKGISNLDMVCID